MNALALSGDTIFAGGEFSAVNGATVRQRLAAFDASGAARPWAPSANAPVRALAVHGGTTFAGGDFTSVNGGAARSGFAAFDSRTAAVDADALLLGAEERNGPLPAVARADALFASPATGLLVGGSFVTRAPAPRTANLALLGLPALPGGPGGTADTTDPVLALSASRRRFRVGARAMPPNGDATAAQRVRAGTTLRLSLSEPARVRFVVLRKGKGRRAGRRCVKPNRRNRARRRCTRLTRAGAYTRSAPAGRSKVAWSGRIRRRALKPGRYLLRATATDLAGNKGTRRSVSIRIVRRRR